MTNEEFFTRAVYAFNNYVSSKMNGAASEAQIYEDQSEKRIWSQLHQDVAPTGEQRKILQRLESVKEDAHQKTVDAMHEYCRAMMKLNAEYQSKIKDILNEL